MRFPEILSQLTKYSTSSKPLYLVGGAVRDSLLGKPCSDFDFVCPENSRQIARTFANENNGDFFVLDEERDTCRVLINTDLAPNLVVDFAAMRGVNIQEDLSKRDFTINAMAVDLLKPEKVIDPFKGGRDLQEKRLRVVTPGSFMDDPLRTIRAVRYALDLGLRMEPGITDLIHSSVSGLQYVSVERKRDEIFKVFSGPKVHTAMQLLKKFEVFDYIPLSITPDFNGAVTLARSMEDVLAWICGEKKPEQQAAFYQSSLLMELGRFREDLRNYYLMKNHSWRDRRSLLFLANLVEKTSELECGLRRLALSVDEIQLVAGIKTAEIVLEELVKTGSIPEPIDIYRYFKTTSSSGIDAAIIMLADQISLLGSEFSQARWLHLLEFTGKLMEAWFNDTDLIAPAPLINGDVLMQHLGLTPGPLVGELLERIIEEQIRGVVTNKDEALAWIEQMMKK